MSACAFVIVSTYRARRNIHRVFISTSPLDPLAFTRPAGFEVVENEKAHEFVSEPGAGGCCGRQLLIQELPVPRGEAKMSHRFLF